MRWAAASLLACVACSPPDSVKVVDGWLTGYRDLDVEAVVANTWAGDKALVRKSVEAVKNEPRSGPALALPPLPLSFEIIEIEKKPAPDRHIILTKVKMKNPLPYEAEKVGQDLGDFPRTRSQRRRFLSVRDGDDWGVKLDLAAVMKRSAFVDAFTAHLESRRFEDAERMLSAVPPLPDEANVHPKDRLIPTLEAELKKARSRRVRTSSTSTTTR